MNWTAADGVLVDLALLRESDGLNWEAAPATGGAAAAADVNGVLAYHCMTSANR